MKRPVVRILIGAFLILLGVWMLLEHFVYAPFPGVMNYITPATSILLGLLTLIGVFAGRH